MADNRKQTLLGVPKPIQRAIVAELVAEGVLSKETLILMEIFDAKVVGI